MKITDSAVERVPKVDINGYTEEQCSEIQRQHKKLLQYSRNNNDNKEVAFVFDSAISKRKKLLVLMIHLNLAVCYMVAKIRLLYTIFQGIAIILILILRFYLGMIIFVLCQ